MAELPVANDLIASTVTEEQFKAALKILVENVASRDWTNANPLFKPSAFTTGDVNNILIEGFYYISNAVLGNILNLPVLRAGSLIVFGTGGLRYQLFKPVNSNEFYFRSGNGGDINFAYLAWQKFATITDITAALTDAVFIKSLVANDSLNTLETGYSRILSDGIGSTIIGLPPQLTSPRRGFIFTFRAGTTSYQKFIRDSSDSIEAYERTGNGLQYTLPEFAWNSWVRVLDSTVLAAADTAQKAWVVDTRESVLKYRNLFTADEISGLDFGRIVAAASKPLIARVGDSIKMSCAASTFAFTPFYWRFSAAHFKNSRISASARILSATAGGGAVATATRFIIKQTSVSGATITSQMFTVGNEAAITTALTARLENITLESTAVYVEVGFEFLGQIARDLYVTDLFVGDTAKGDFIRPSAAPSNLFIDQFFCSKYADVWNDCIITNTAGVPQLNFSSTSLRQVLYKFPAVGTFKPGAVIRLKADIFADVAGPSLLLIFYTSTGTEISRIEKACALVNVWETVSVETVVPVNCATVGIRLTKYGTSSIGQFKNIELISGANPIDIAARYPLNVLFVDGVLGDDANSGTRNSPVKTLSRAMLLATENTKIVVQEGDYTEAPQITRKIINLEVVAARNSKVRLVGGTKLTGFTQTSGMAKVWQAALATTPVGSSSTGYWLYQHGIADTSTLIPANERSKYHLGRTYRLPDFTRIWRVGSIAEIEAAARPSWFWDSGILYLSCAGFVDPNNSDIRVPDNAIAPFYTSDSTKDQCLKLTGIESMYWLHGFRTWDFARVEFERCKAMGNKGNGFEHSDSMFVVRTACESVANWIDGTGGHVTRANVTKLSCRYLGFDNYEHDNGDDGQSLHEMWAGADFGGLIEYNGDRGIATAVGAHTYHNGVTVRKSGQGSGLYSIDDGVGFACVGTVTAGEGGLSTDMELVNCIAEGCLTNYSIAGGDANTLRATGCKSFDPVNNHFSVSAGLMTLTDCGASGAGTIKKTSGTGVIAVRNTTLVT